MRGHQVTSTVSIPDDPVVVLMHALSMPSSGADDLIPAVCRKLHTPGDRSHPSNIPSILRVAAGNDTHAKCTLLCARYTAFSAIHTSICSRAQHVILREMLLPHRAAELSHQPSHAISPFQYRHYSSLHRDKSAY